jgi:hypothetical protein
VACEYCFEREVVSVGFVVRELAGSQGKGGRYRGKSRLSRRTCFQLRRRLCPDFGLLSASSMWIRLAGEVGSRLDEEQEGKITLIAT